MKPYLSFAHVRAFHVDLALGALSISMKSYRLALWFHFFSLFFFFFLCRIGGLIQTRATPRCSVQRQQSFFQPRRKSPMKPPSRHRICHPRLGGFGSGLAISHRIQPHRWQFPRPSARCVMLGGGAGASPLHPALPFPAAEGLAGPLTPAPGSLERSRPAASPLHQPTPHQ